ncbi:MAG TPA: helix-turn-helix transcriptional regulator, partial [Acidimicrobiales bacterium]|nr:helix-turn-helix transcriptional regulator [Acidimicrobiales bacterium]
MLTPNQVVAYNITQARRLRGWTQEEAAVRLEPFIGERWTKVTWSAAERSVAGARVRTFSADDIVALAQAFKLPIVWFFLPPDPTGKGTEPRVGVTGKGLTPAELIDLATTEGLGELQRRLAEAFMHLPQGVRTDAQASLDALVYARASALIAERMGDLHALA